MMRMRTATISTMMAKSRRMSRTSIAPMALLLFRRLLAARDRTVLAARDGRVAGVVAAGADRVVRVRVDRRVAAIARVSSPLPQRPRICAAFVSLVRAVASVCRAG